MRPVKAHVRPIAFGGSDGIDNIQPLCRSCMAATMDETNYLTEWRARQTP
jgi:5-methylcytosine-specific restriction endonuclease McrA